MTKLFLSEFIRDLIYSYIYQCNFADGVSIVRDLRRKLFKKLDDVAAPLRTSTNFSRKTISQNEVQSMHIWEGYIPKTDPSSLFY